MTALRGCQLGALMGLAAASSACGVEGQGQLAGSTGSNLPQQEAAGAAGGGGTAGASGDTGSPGAAAGGTNGGGSAGAGATGAPLQAAAFATDLEGFRINYYCSGNPPACTPVMDAAPEADAGVADAGDTPAPAAGNDFVEAVFDPEVGEPEPGAARITLQFSADGQLADFARNFGDGMTPGLDLTGKVLTARARVQAGGAPTVAGKFYIKTGMTYSYADSGETLLVPDTWVTLRYQSPSYVSDSAVYDIADVREIGIEILGRGAAAPAVTVVHIDTIAF